MGLLRWLKRFDYEQYGIKVVFALSHPHSEIFLPAGTERVRSGGFYFLFNAKSKRFCRDR